MYDGGEQLVTGWHFHDVHEIEYACRGVVEVETRPVTTCCHPTKPRGSRRACSIRRR